MSKIIVAVPGSGKTTAIAEEIKQAIAAGTADPSKVFAVTFTREAANELKERCHPDIHASTIHSLAHTILKGVQDPNEIDILDAGMFYDELLYRAGKNLDTFEADILAVDEAQDLSAKQFAFLKELVTKTKNLIVVGDPLQSIFSFTGGNPRYMKDFKALLPDIEVVPLSKSYRLPKEIVTYVNSTFTPKVRIEAVRDGGYVNTEVVAENLIPTRALKGLKENSGLLVRTNAEILRLVRILGSDVKKVNYTLPMSAHPYVGFASAIIGMGSFISPEDLLNASTMLGGLSWAGAKALRHLKRLRMNRQTVEDLFGPEHLNRTGDYEDLPIVSIKARKDVYNLIEILDTYDDFYGKSDPDSIMELIRRVKKDSYNVETIWEDSVNTDAAIVEAVRRRAMMNAETYYKVDNGSSIEIMTIHAAKGKEFDNVVLTVNGRSVSIYEQEEFRVLYVGSTRSRESLVVLVPEIYTHDRSRANILDTMNRAAGFI